MSTEQMMLLFGGIWLGVGLLTWVMAKDAERKFEQHVDEAIGLVHEDDDET